MNDTPTGRDQKSINFRLHALDSSLFRSAKQYYGVKFGLGVPEMRILSNLDAEGPLAANQIVALTVMDKALVSRILTALHKRGSIEHTPTSSTTRPVWMLSKAGCELVHRLRPLWREREAMVQAVLTPDEQETLKEMLERLFIASETLRIEETRSLQQPRQPSQPKTGTARHAEPRKAGRAAPRSGTAR
ncbi:MAG TPA: MarR family winged helix-turn-helix transcriptional regulator [Rhodopila sp.]